MFSNCAPQVNPFSADCSCRFIVLSVVETGARHIMASDAVVPNVGRAAHIQVSSQQPPRDYHCYVPARDSAPPHDGSG
ncbi:MAG: hypothetical protein FP819_15155 [Rhizobiaceae bacterium]|nr:hypothetical protein [Rhizobiaceae bacterium]